MKLILPLHLKQAKLVENPISIMEEALEIVRIVNTKEIYIPGSKHISCFAVAQPQVSNDPLAYFVLNPEWKSVAKDFGGFIVVNPRIVSKDKTTKAMMAESCLSYPFRPPKKIKRYGKIIAEYTIINKLKAKEKNIIKITKELTNLSAWIFQHEMEHLNGRSIYSQ